MGGGVAAGKGILLETLNGAVSIPHQFAFATGNYSVVTWPRPRRGIGREKSAHQCYPLASRRLYHVVPLIHARPVREVVTTRIPDTRNACLLETASRPDAFAILTTHGNNKTSPRRIPRAVRSELERTLRAGDLFVKKFLCQLEASPVASLREYTRYVRHSHLRIYAKMIWLDITVFSLRAMAASREQRAELSRVCRR